MPTTEAEEQGLNARITQNIEAIGAEDLVSVLADGADIYAELTSSFIENIKFYGQTLREWADDLMVVIPSDKELDPHVFREVSIELLNKTQIASNYYSVAASLEEAIKGSRDVKRSDVVKAIVMAYQSGRGARRPAGTIIDQMADSYMANTVSSEVAAKMVRNFWKQRLDQLEKTRKILEMISMSLHVEMKWTAQ